MHYLARLARVKQSSHNHNNNVCCIGFKSDSTVPLGVVFIWESRKRSSGRCEHWQSSSGFLLYSLNI